MNSNAAMRIMERFVELPLPQRQAFLSKMRAEEMDFTQFPIPSSRAKFKEIPASYAQRRQWFLWQLSPESAAYNMSAALRVEGDLNRQALEQAFSSLQSRHESLRTHFLNEQEYVLQVVHPEPYAFIDEHSLPQELAVEQKSALIKLFVENETSRAFNLRQGPLLRLSLLKINKDEHVLVLVQHHIVSDGWSMGVMVEELLALYAGYSSGRVVELPELPIQYADYAIWQKQWLEAGESERQLTYWKQQLGEDAPVLELPSDRPRSSVQSYRGSMHDIVIPAEIALGLSELAQRSQSTVFMLLLASFQALLHRYSGQSDIRVGVPIANRNRVETERLIGFFVNTQVLKADIDPEMRFSDLLVQVKRHALEAQSHQDLPFEQLVEALHPERNLSHHPLFQVMLNHQTERRVIGTESSLSDVKITALDWENKTTPFDLTLDTTEYEGGIDARLRYATDLFDASTITRMSDHWVHLLQSIVLNPEQKIGELSLLNITDYQALVKDWTDTPQVHTSVDTIHQRIESQAKQHSDSIAVVFGTKSLTYRELNSRSNQLAHQLRRQGIGPESRVGLAVERSLEMIIGILAILKAGGAYVPLDPAYPVDRLHYMIEDSGIQLLLTQAHLIPSLYIPDNIQVIELESDLSCEDDSNPITLATPDNLAYIIYTSGSTGKPKGALLTHHHVMRLFKATDEHFEFTNTDVWSVFHSYAFDFSVWEIFGGLLYGGKLVIVPFETSRSPKDFHQLLQTEGITVLNQTPSAFLQLQAEITQTPETHKTDEMDKSDSSALVLRYVVFGGEALDVRSLKAWFDRYGDTQPKIINMYGITETTVHVTYRQIKQQDLEKATTSPIGQPLNDLSGQILDTNLHPTLLGSRGEIYIGGAGLARGYNNRPGLTAERFVPDLFSTEGTRLYRTGDVAQRSTDHIINYEGRLDHQVKIRGFRIELGEIEAKLQSHPEVKQSVVMASNTRTGTQLVGYIVSRTKEDISPEMIKAYLKEDLPDYMVPAYLVQLEALPLTTNGKLDKKALRLPDINSTKEYVAPRTELEKQLAGIWQEVLNVPHIGLTDNFFDLGGHSLLAVKLTSTIKSKLNMEVGLHDIMFEPTLHGMAGKLRGNLSSLISPVVLLNGANIENKKKLFCLHPGGGSSYCYYPLAESLKEHYAVYGLMCRTFVNKDWVDNDWNEVVSSYTQHIRELQPQGPYYLLGWSLGGGLAMSITNELERAGEEVKFLGLIDTLMPADLDVQIFMDNEVLESDKSESVQNNIKPEFARTIEFIKNILPTIDSKEIIEGLKEVDMEPLNKEEILDQVLIWVSTHKDMDYELLKEAAQNFALESEISIGHELMDRFDRLSKSFTNCHVKATFNVWLASLDKTDKQLDLLRRAFDSIGKAKSIEQIEATHNDLIFSQKLLSSISNALASLR